MKVEEGNRQSPPERRKPNNKGQSPLATALPKYGKDEVRNMMVDAYKLNMRPNSNRKAEHRWQKQLRNIQARSVQANKTAKGKG